MLDIKWIRENEGALDTALNKRGAEPMAATLLALDDKRRSVIQKLQDMQSRRNAASKEIGIALGQKNSELAEKLKAEVATIKETMPVAEQEERDAVAALEDALSRIPNVPFDDVPVGKDEHDNVVKHVVGEKPRWNHAAKEHYEIGEALGMMDFERATKLSGSRFTVLTGQLARLERALGQFMIDMHTTEHGYTEVSSPLMVKGDAMYGTGQLPKFEEDLFKTTDGRYLIPTAEVTLTNLVSGEILEQEKLPLRFTALTPSFRSEAGSAGRDTRGMLRQHQFWKCELVSITDQESSIAEHERMTECAENMLKRLGLHFRTMTLCTGDMGFGARKTYDIEVWLPGQDTYREISSCSVCGDFQGRRMNARYRSKDDKALKFVHTLNGSGVAVGRCLIAVMENYLNEDGSVTIPDALLPYMGGLTRIERAA
ncbi:serine--tRNA ligase [Neorhizobium galegae]|uniref:serine--tRNA ligase n=1 Tax=Neorhizobium galegae TaxID=399 RepID=UPI000621EDD2|nr:serine--tRNA ligase [Neorhizobium galegae]MCQ1764814.1 serine--tRNA ligase [Neorhizobium galegae]MCQ1845566.1 serine--tRNA ligase [Neorhizobium galegae]CDZ38842.1 Serine--tRNA ligase [Neorhizobium galegae bv. officinalis]